MTCRSGWSGTTRRLVLAAVATTAAVAGMATAPAAAADIGAPPADVVAQAAGNGQLTVSWSLGDCGPAGLTDNTVIAEDAGGTPVGTTSAPATATAATVSGLINGTGYQVTVTANCADGTTLTSTPSEMVTPAAPPDPPAATAVTGDRSATVFWTLSGDGGSPVTGFTVTASPGGATVSLGADNSSAVVPGLTNGIAYTFTVTATNAVGSSTSPPAGPVVPYGAPNAPLNVRVSTGDGSVTATWTAPAENGQPIVGYALSANGTSGPSSVQVSGAARQATVVGLTNGAPYALTVSSVDAAGASAAVAATATPGPPPGAPPGVSATPGTTPTTGGASALVTWAPATSNGTPVTGYVVTTSPGGKTIPVSAAATSTTVPGLSVGQAYTFTVTATSSSGPGPVSKPSAPLTITQIDAAYAALGGPASFLGVPVNAEFPVGAGRERDYAAGRIYWSSTTGAHAVRGAILTKYVQLGGPTGFVGFPSGDQTTAGAGQFSQFTGATVFWTSASGAHEVHGTNLAHYLQLGGPTGFLGFPTTDETVTPDKAGRYNHFTAGSMYWTATTGSHEVHGPIRDKWSSLGWERSILGYPKTDQLTTGAGQSSQFTGGTVYWTSTTAAHEVHGANLAHYLQLGGPTGFLGFPITDEAVTPDNAGRYNHFSGGSMYWTATTGSHEVHGAIRDKWAAMGWERSVLGYPTRDEVAVTGGRQSSFVHGIITWTAAKGAVSTTRGDDIVRMTRTHLGARYVFGAAGPTTFDCSGLVQYVHRQIGIGVPRTSEAQAAAARPIAKTAAQPGDLIFLLNNSHVGVYVGGGQMIDAPKTGDVVRQRAIWTSVYTVGRFW